MVKTLYKVAGAVALLGGAVYLATAPKNLGGGVFSPSWLTIATFTKPKTDYSKEEYPNTYSGELKILVVCTEKADMTMVNGAKFHTGNHPVETFLPMLHMKAAGFDFDVATATGAPAIFEEWAMPLKDNAVVQLRETLAPKLATPLALASVPTELDGYAAIFIPGGHGALLDLPESADLGRLLRAANAAALPTFSLCHGPGTLVAAAVGAPEDAPFTYAGYEIMVFPDSIDKFTPYLGYLPGAMPVWIGAELEAKGLKIQNENIDGSVHVYKELVTGDSPLASNNLGKAAAKILLEKYA